MGERERNRVLSSAWLLASGGVDPASASPRSSEVTVEATPALEDGAAGASRSSLFTSKLLKSTTAGVLWG